MLTPHHGVAALTFHKPMMQQHRNNMTALSALTYLLGISLMICFSNAFVPVPMDVLRRAKTQSCDLVSIKISELAKHAGISQPIHASQKSTVSSLHLFGNMFGSDVDSSRETKELARLDNLGTTDQQYESLSVYIEQWSKFLTEDPKGMGLVTPVNIVPLDSTATEDGVKRVSGVKVLFKKTKTGGSYKSNKEEKAVEQGGTTVKKKKVIREGGVEIKVEQLVDGKVQVRARRCETDEETIIKEMSEEAIKNDLIKAVGVWKKQQ